MNTWKEKNPLSTLKKLEDIDVLIEERKQARVDKNWARADEIRDQLDSKGIVLEDKAEGTIWKVK